MESKPALEGFKLFETEYTLYKHGETFKLLVKYCYREAPEELKVLGAVPDIALTEADMDEIDLHCWGDRAKAQSLEFLEDEIYPLLGFRPSEEPCCA